MAIRVLLAVLGLSAAACSPQREPISIHFEAQFGGEPLNCGPDQGVQLTDLRFYVYELAIRDADGQRHALDLPDMPPWQAGEIALLDLEDASGGCANGTAVMNAAIAAFAPDVDWNTLEFIVGVPFEKNHGDPLLAEFPLGDPAMHWHWRGGYKFLRAGFRSTDDGYWLHLGSTGCKGTIRNITHCTAPNRVTVTLENFDPDEDVIIVDLQALVPDEEQHDGQPDNCSSSPAEASCAGPFAALGLAFGDQVATGRQQLFSRGIRP
ncbi:MAG: metallo-mystery pair system four-Cys motif protein [Gammaproteobacteria bacterium]|nr:metallo-mystery pair system four-Cys motif protein [Gammaproteobacteria bacterium]